MTKKVYPRKRGFTLIELLVVISVIGVLATVVLVSYGPAQKQARDVQRKSDLKQYQAALENFANTRAGMVYPSKTTAVEAGTICAALGISGTCPADPKSPAYAYQYISDGTGSPNINAINYILWARLENTTGYWLVCSNGKTGLSAAAPTSSACSI